MMKKRSILLAVCLCLGLLLAGCGGSTAGETADVEACAGTYTSIGLYLDGQYLTEESFSGMVTTLDADGTGSLDWGEDNQGPISEWTAEDGKLLIKAGVSEMEGTVADGVMVLDLGDGIMLAFVGEGIDVASLNPIPLDEYMTQHPDALNQ